MKRDQVFELRQRFKLAEEVFHIDRLMAIHGHTVLRCMCELNSTELTRFVREYNVIGDFSLKTIHRQTEVNN